MKVKRHAIAFAALLALAHSGPAWCVDHNNVDTERPLRFDDAYAIGYRERAVEVGFGAGWPEHDSAVLDAKVEFKYGFLRNADAGIALSPTYDTGADEYRTENVEVDFFHHLQREIGRAPAFAYRAGLGIPTVSDASGVEGRLRAIMTTSLRQYDKIHLNLDAVFRSDARERERDASFGAVLGYSVPLGYPRAFTQTLLAEFAIEQSEFEDFGWVGSAGIGVRRQIGFRSVVDAAVEADVVDTDDSDQNQVRLVLGYSAGF